jgi:hypothetical protein
MKEDEALKDGREDEGDGEWEMETKMNDEDR